MYKNIFQKIYSNLQDTKTYISEQKISHVINHSQSSLHFSITIYHMANP